MIYRKSIKRNHMKRSTLSYKCWSNGVKIKAGRTNVNYPKMAVGASKASIPQIFDQN